MRITEIPTFLLHFQSIGRIKSIELSAKMNVIKGMFFVGLTVATLTAAANSVQAASYAGLCYDHNGRSAREF